MGNPSELNTERLKAYVIDPDSNSRHRLKEATTPVYCFEEVFQFNRFSEALSALDAGRRCDVAFLASHLEEAAIAAFIQDAKGLRAGQDAAFVSVIRSQKQDKSSIAKAVLNGLDGFLFEPYSVDALSEIAQLAWKVRKERASDRQKVALTLMLSDIIRQIDLVAYIRSCELEPTGSMRRLRELCHDFAKLSPELQAAYLDLAVDMFEAAPLPNRSFQAGTYKGASLRVKKKMADKLTAEVESQMSSGGTSLPSKKPQN